MLERDPRRVAAWAAAAVVLALFAAWYLARGRPTASAAPPPDAVPIAVTTPAKESAARVIVDVSGAVKHPGVYQLTASDRVQDALARAGGPTRHADVSQLNRAAKLEDGRQILVPTRARAA